MDLFRNENGEMEKLDTPLYHFETSTEASKEDGPHNISPLLIFFFFLVLDAFIIAVFYFCYFMRTKSRSKQTPTTADAPPPYQIAIIEEMYPTVQSSEDPIDADKGLPSYNDIVHDTNNKV